MPKISKELNERALAEVQAWAKRVHHLGSDRAFCERVLAIAIATTAKFFFDEAQPSAIRIQATSPRLTALAAELAAQKKAMAEAIARSSLGGIGLSDRTTEELLIALVGG